MSIKTVSAACFLALSFLAPTTSYAAFDLSVDLSGTLGAGTNAPFTFDFDVKNAGPDSAPSPSVRVELPSGSKFVMIDAPGWTCGWVALVANCNRASLAAAESTVFTVDMTTPSMQGYVAVGATVEPKDPWQSNNSGSLVVKLTPTGNTPPVVINRVETTMQNEPVQVPVFVQDPDLQSYTFTVVQSPAHGVASFNGNVLTYTPEPTFFGVDQLTYKANDGLADSNVAQVTLHVIEEIIFRDDFEALVDPSP